MDVETLKQAGVTVTKYEHYPDQRATIHEPVSIQVWLARGEGRTFSCKVYKKMSDPRRGFVLNDDDYLRLVVERYTMNVAEYDAITNVIREHRGRFDQLSLEYRKRVTLACQTMRRMLDEFLK